MNTWSIKKLFKLNPCFGVTGECFIVRCVDKTVTNAHLTSSLFNVLLKDKTFARDYTITFHGQEELDPRLELRLSAGDELETFQRICPLFILDLLRYEVTEIYVTVWNRNYI
jgi:hypothetical protein